MQYGKVTWRAVQAIADGPDLDALPDARPVTGSITFAPSVPVLYVQGVANPTSVFPTATTYMLATDGTLKDAQGRTGVYLLATDTAGINPPDWHWTATFNLNNGAARGTIIFKLSSGETVDLTDEVPLVTGSDGVLIVRGPKGDPGMAGIDWNQITNKPDFSDVAVSGDYLSLENRPTLTNVVRRVLYNDATSSYPVRPAGVPAGFCEFIGPVEPTGWLIGDTWTPTVEPT
jgi:hypothetical protein